MDKEISGFSEHPDSERLLDYDIDPPSGKWIGRLDDRAWGTSANLLCFFTHLDSGKKYRLSVYEQNDCRPADEGPSFDEELIGSTFEVTVRKSQGRAPIFQTARRLP